MDMTIFEASIWDTASLDKKKAAIQELENYYAAKQGRPELEIITVKPTTVNAQKIAGAYDYDNDPKHLQINEDMLNDPRCKFEVLDTIIHEGRHAYQYFVVDKDRKDLEKEETIQLWRENQRKGCYNSFDPNPLSKTNYLYRYQSTERDANDYAKAELNINFSQLPGEEKQYQSYRTMIDSWDSAIRTEGVSSKGLNFEKKIDEEIHKNYEYIQKMAAGIPQNKSATTIRERLSGEYTFSQDEKCKEREDVLHQSIVEGFDFHKALAAHIMGNEEMYAQLDAQRDGQNVDRQMSQQDKGIFRG